MEGWGPRTGARHCIRRLRIIPPNMPQAPNRSVQGMLPCLLDNSSNLLTSVRAFRSLFSFFVCVPNVHQNAAKQYRAQKRGDKKGKVEILIWDGKDVVGGSPGFKSLYTLTLQ